MFIDWKIEYYSCYAKCWGLRTPHHTFCRFQINNQRTCCERNKFVRIYVCTCADRQVKLPCWAPSGLRTGRSRDSLPVLLFCYCPNSPNTRIYRAQKTENELPNSMGQSSNYLKKNNIETCLSQFENRSPTYST